MRGDRRNDWVGCRCGSAIRERAWRHGECVWHGIWTLKSIRSGASLPRVAVRYAGSRLAAIILCVDAHPAAMQYPSLARAIRTQRAADTQES